MTSYKHNLPEMCRVNARHARKAIDAHAMDTGQTDETDEATLADLLEDLHHLFGPQVFNHRLGEARAAHREARGLVTSKDLIREAKERVDAATREAIRAKAVDAAKEMRAYNELAHKAKGPAPAFMGQPVTTKVDMARPPETAPARKKPFPIMAGDPVQHAHMRAEFGTVVGRSASTFSASQGGKPVRIVRVCWWRTGLTKNVAEEDLTAFETFDEAILEARATLGIIVDSHYGPKPGDIVPKREEADIPW